MGGNSRLRHVNDLMHAILKMSAHVIVEWENAQLCDYELAFEQRKEPFIG